MSDYSKLKELAEGCRDEVIRSDGWSGTIKDAGLLHRDEQFLKECSPEAVLALIADLERHQRIMLAAACDIGAIGQAMGADSEADGSELEGLATELRKDAERYRWLRDSSESVHQFYLSTPIWFTGVKFSKENVDSTIDAAMSAEVTP